nr:hypothetical protein [Tanacetum cinerariifolium]
PPPAQYLIHKSLAVSRRHVAVSYWTVASDVAPTSAPVNAGQRRSTPPAIGQRRRITVVIGSQRWRSTTVADGEPPLTAAGPPLTVVGRQSTPGHAPVWIGSGPGLDRVWAGSGSGPPYGMPRVSHVCTRVSHVCPRGIHVDADVDNMH